MNNITLDTTNFSEQLGLYDFFDVIVSGAVFVFGLSAISCRIYELLWEDVTVIKGLGIVLLVYISGVVLQEIGSVLDRHCIGIKNFTRSTFLFDIRKVSLWEKMKYWHSIIRKKDEEKHENKTELTNPDTTILGTDQECAEKESSDTSAQKGKWNWVLSNKTLLAHYRNLAKQIYEDCFPGEKLDEKMYMNEKFNSFVFSIIQYRVSCQGKDKKVEKLRALYSLARTLMVCFSVFVIFILSVNWLGFFSTLLIPRCGNFANVFFVASFFLAILFFFRMKKCKKYMALIMLGNYDAILQASKENAPRCRMEMSKKDINSEFMEEVRG